MPAIGEIVELKAVIQTIDVERDIALASYVVWQAIQNRMSQISHPDPHMWTGFQRDVINELWPGLHENVMMRITAYLRDSKNVVVVGNNAESGEPTYKVSHEFEELDSQPKGIEVNAASTIEKIATVAAAPKPHPLGLTVRGLPRQKNSASKVNATGKWGNLTPNFKGFYVCKDVIGADGCRYATERLGSFLAHQGKLKGKHPEVAGFDGQCQFCTDIYADPQRLSDHTSRFHHDIDVNYCRTCWNYYTETPKEHRAMHNRAAASTPVVAETPTSEVVMVTDTLPPLTQPGHTRWVTTAHKAAETKIVGDEGYAANEITDAHWFLTQILNENVKLREENAALRDQNAIFLADNERLAEQEAKFEKIAALLSELK